jgi:predicted nucleotidyltransferase
MVTRDIAIIESKKFILDLRNIGINLRKAYLFGSYLTQKQHKDSDIDVALVADEFIGVGPVDIKLILKILRNYKSIHATTYSNSDYEEGDPFLEEIKKNGLELM